MRYLLVLFLVAAPAALAQNTAGAAFHTAAQQFIGDDAQAALATIAKGLATRPGDAKLTALRDEIMKQQEQEQQQNGDQDQEQQEGEQGDQQNGQGENDDQQQGDQDGENDNQGDDPDQGDQPDQPEPGDQDGDGQPDQPGDQQPPPRPGQAQPQPGQMTQAQAERILQALGNEEANVLKRKAQKRGPARRVEKDW